MHAYARQRDLTLGGTLSAERVYIGDQCTAVIVATRFNQAFEPIWRSQASVPNGLPEVSTPMKTKTSDRILAQERSKRKQDIGRDDLKPDTQRAKVGRGGSRGAIESRGGDGETIVTTTLVDMVHMYTLTPRFSTSMDDCMRGRRNSGICERASLPFVCQSFYATDSPTRYHCTE